MLHYLIIASTRVKDLEEKGFKDTTSVLEKLFRKGRYDQIIREIHDWMNILLDEKRGQYGEESFDLWQKGSGRPRQNISAITAFYEGIGEAREESMELIAKSAPALSRLLIVNKILRIVITDYGTYYSIKRSQINLYMLYVSMIELARLKTPNRLWYNSF